MKLYGLMRLLIKLPNATEGDKGEAYIDAELKNEYNLSDKEITDVKRNVKGRARLYAIIAILPVLL